MTWYCPYYTRQNNVQLELRAESLIFVYIHMYMYMFNRAREKINLDEDPRSEWDKVSQHN